MCQPAYGREKPRCKCITLQRCQVAFPPRVTELLQLVSQSRHLCCGVHYRRHASETGLHLGVWRRMGRSPAGRSRASLAESFDYLSLRFGHSGEESDLAAALVATSRRKQGQF